MKVVVDASVTLKWLFDDPATEPLTQEATHLMQAVADGSLEVIQPIPLAGRSRRSFNEKNTAIGRNRYSIADEYESSCCRQP